MDWQGQQLSPGPEDREARSEVFQWAEALIGAVVFVILCFTFGVRTALVQGISMQDTLHHNDRLLITRLGGDFSYGDIVVITQPNDEDETIIKRIIATEGQMVDIDFGRGQVYVDGQLLDEPYIAEPTYSQYDVQFPLTVPKGHVFVMGDNRNNSKDSRFAAVGTIDTRYILGRVCWRLYPLGDFGTVR